MVKEEYGTYKGQKFFKTETYRLGQSSISEEQAQKLLKELNIPIKSTQGTIECPNGFNVLNRTPACDKSKNPAKCETSMWGKNVQYCKKQ